MNPRRRDQYALAAAILGLALTFTDIAACAQHAATAPAGRAAAAAHMAPSRAPSAC